MLGVVEGFSVIAVIILVGFALGRSGVIDDAGQRTIATLVFYAATPSLLFTTIARAPIDQVITPSMIATGGTALVLGLGFALLSRFAWKRTTGEAVIAGWSASYVNIGNLGIPIAAYVLGDIRYIAPVLLFQLLVLSPIGLMVLDSRGGGEGRRSRLRWIRFLFNPLLIASILGVVCSATGFSPPQMLWDPIAMIAGISVPATLIVFGLSLRNGWAVPGRETHLELGVLMLIRTVLHPVLAWLVGGPLLGFSGLELFAIVLLSTLPTAQNVYINALRYQVGQSLARDAVFLTTFASPLAVLVVALLFG